MSQMCSGVKLRLFARVNKVTCETTHINCKRFKYSAFFYHKHSVSMATLVIKSDLSWKLKSKYANWKFLHI